VRIVCPSARGLQPLTVAAALAAAREASAAAPDGVEFLELEPRDDAYFDLLASLWAAAADVAIVEQDIVAPVQAFQELAACPQPWCTFGYPLRLKDGRELIHHGLGLVRFRAGLLAQTPDLFEAVATHESPVHPARHWCHLDAVMIGLLRSRGFRQHFHAPVIEHLVPAPSHGCV
jgi:hypothetical protein